jgi:hypothetical protein
MLSLAIIYRCSCIVLSLLLSLSTYAATTLDTAALRQGEISASVVGVPARPMDSLRLYSTDEVSTAGFPDSLRTFVSLVATPGIDIHGIGSFTGINIAFKTLGPGELNKVLWYMMVRFGPIDNSYSTIAVVESKVEAKIYCSPDTYKRIYGTDFKSSILAEERRPGKHPRAFFSLSDGIGGEHTTRFESRKIFEWPVDRRFPGVAGGSPGDKLIAPGRVFNHGSLYRSGSKVS